MARWAQIEAESPAFAAAVRAAFDAHRHKTMATLRADGSPRISGTEADFVDGDLWFGSMPNARKARDLQRDPRFALHSGTTEPDEPLADAKLSGRVEEVTDPERKRAVAGASAAGEQAGPYHLFRAEISEVALTRVEGDLLVVEFWREGGGVRRVERR